MDSLGGHMFLGMSDPLLDSGSYAATYMSFSGALTLLAKGRVRVEVLLV